MFNIIDKIKPCLHPNGLKRNNLQKTKLIFQFIKERLVFILATVFHTQIMKRSKILTSHHSWEVQNEGRPRNDHTIHRAHNPGRGTGYNCSFMVIGGNMEKEHKDRVTFTIDPQLHKELKRLMKRIDRQKSWLLCHAIRKLLESKDY